MIEGTQAAPTGSLRWLSRALKNSLPWKRIFSGRLHWLDRRRLDLVWNLPMSSRAAGLTSPPRTVLAFRVGIVGHRPNRLPKDKESLDTLGQMLRDILQDVKAGLSNYAA